jgi:hypothetical protein
LTEQDVSVTEENDFTVFNYLLNTMAGYNYQQNTLRNVYTLSAILLNKMGLFFYVYLIILCNFFAVLYFLITHIILVLC